MYARHQTTLASLTEAVLANTDPLVIMRQAVTLVAQTLAVPYSAIWELLPDRAICELRFDVGWRDDTMADSTMTISPTSPIACAILGTTPLIVMDWLTETRFQQPAALQRRGVVSSVVVAIPGQPHPYSCLGVDVTASRPFNDEEIHFLQAVANVLGLAIVRAQSNQERKLQLEQQMHDIEQLIAAAQEKAVLEERQRLARDLHDSVTQALYSVTLHAEAVRRMLMAGDSSSAADSLRVLQTTAQEALDEMRLLTFELRPPILQQVGLVAALQARLNAVEGRANLETKLIADGDDDLPLPVEEALYRIAQEALNNAFKHAQARHITVQLRRTQNGVVLDVADDGVGFDPASAGDNGGMGLRGMAERIAQLEGHLALRSEPGAGTQLYVEIPV